MSTARWQDLMMVNYEVDPSLLAERVPAGTELDLFEGRCFVSLVGFLFLGTRVMGVPIPYHIDFEEINLRFYVKRESDGEIRRGVTFIKEIVPRRAIAFVARAFYGEPYEAARMWNRNDAGKVEYGALNFKGVNTFKATRGDEIGIPAPRSHEHFIIEHYWGYTRRSAVRTDEYKVEHPLWELYANRHVKIKVNFAGWYGKEFYDLRYEKPYSVVVAKGSEIAVYRGQTLRIKAL
ncbi:MAG: DUF2071 domain-containing protein [Acidobacteria bacterium]|nr:DUF2071 domain-containing protein [Acidobacteriota bacterium]